MRFFLSIFFLLIIDAFPVRSVAAISSYSINPVGNRLFSGSSLPALARASENKHVEKNRRTSFKQNLFIRLLEWKRKLKSGRSGDATDNQIRWGKLSLIFAGAAMLLLFVPAVIGAGGAIAALSLPSAVAGLILGIKSIKDNTNAMGLIGTIISGSMLVLFLISFIVLVLVFTSGVY